MLLATLALPLQSLRERIDELPPLVVNAQARIVTGQVRAQRADVAVPEASRLERGLVGLENFRIGEQIEPRVERLPLRELPQVDDILAIRLRDQAERREITERDALVQRQLHREVQIRPLLVRLPVADEGGRIRVLLLALERLEMRFELRPQRLRRGCARHLRLFVERRRLYSNRQQHRERRDAARQ